ncbi:MAG TPA: glycosyltransferase family 39 protein, partial [Nannocystaceae bacterium]|nr:glycosyltransferase family 39 protein [Nannocystaceae bacterium]
RVVYHLMYVAEVPFAAAPISDGHVYEQAARDIIAHPPWGTEAFWLQGLYAYLLALSMAIGGLGVALLVQIVLAGVALFALHAGVRAMFGARAAAITLAMALAVPALAFYENKFLSAVLAILAECLVVWTYARAEGRDGWAARVGCGAAAGLAVLARPNLLLVLPTTLWALVRTAPAGTRRLRVVLWFTLGVGLALAPMAVRNAVVTGRASVFPAHGGGTSFYIGNNAAARGVWNTADGVLSGDVAHEVEELGSDDVGEKMERERAIGREMYRRGFADIAADPGRWLVLEARKLWLLVGNDELAQDYDRLGERELLPWFWHSGLPFGVVLALALLGARAVRRGEHGAARLGLLGGLAAATVIANLVFFTSSQHRLPLFIPLLVLAAPGVRAIADAIRARGEGLTRADKIAAGIALVVAAQAVVPRTRVHSPSAVHYYNLALAWDRVGEQRRALAAFDRALAQRPDHPVIRLERALLRNALGYHEGARADLVELATLPNVPEWVRRRADDELAALGPAARPR